MRFLQLLGIFLIAAAARGAQPQAAAPGALPEVFIDGNSQNVTLNLMNGKNFLLSNAIKINGEAVGLCVIDSGANVSALDVSVIRKLRLESADGKADSRVASPFSARSI